MNKNDSLSFLQACIDRIANATEEDIEMFKMKYDIHCVEKLTSSEFEFISPADLKSFKIDSVEEIKVIISKNNILSTKNKVKMDYYFVGSYIKNSQGNDNAAFAA